MQQLNLISGKTKEEIAIDFIREHEPPGGWAVGISFGKDSTVLYDIVKKSHTRHQFYYSVTGIDPPEIMQFGKKHFPDVIWKRPKRSFYKEIWFHGFPHRVSKWCCNTLKKQPFKGISDNWLMGIRAEESWKRASRDNPDFYKGQWRYKPLFDWLEWEIWEYIESNGLPYCSLYDEGFSRIGCVPCVSLCHGIRGDLKRNMDRWPGYFKALEHAMASLFHNHLCVVNPRSGGYNYRRETDFETFINNWYRGR